MTLSRVLYSKMPLTKRLKPLCQMEHSHVRSPLIGSNIVISKWVFNVKYKTNRTIKKFKARLVARGFL